MEKNKKLIITFSAVFIAIFAVMLALVPIQRRQEFNKKWGKIAELAKTDKRAEFIIENEELYSEDILYSLKSDVLELDFVYNYAFHKDDYNTMSYTKDELSMKAIPRLYMDDYRWCYQTIGGYYIAHQGCTAVSLTMAYLFLTGRDDTDPKKIAEIAENLDAVGIFGGVEDKKIGDICDELGLSSKMYSYCSGIEKTSHADIRTAKEIIDSGHVLLVGMNGETFGVHMIVISGYNGDDFFINDPADREKSDRLWKFEELESEMMFMYDISKK